jgi:hypothetical protein
LVELLEEGGAEVHPFVLGELALGNLGFTRPDEVLINCFGFEPEEVLTLPICRTELLIWRHGRRQTPFEGT